MNRGKEFRLQTQYNNSPLQHHSMNQFIETKVRQGELHIHPSRRTRLAEKKQERKIEEADIGGLPFSAEIFNSATDAVRGGDATPFYTAYLKTHLDQFEETLQ